MAGRILLTGGAGYIGSHTFLALRAAGYDPIILDDFSNANADVPDRLAQISGAAVAVLHADVRDETRLRQIFSDHKFDAVIHFAAKKAVGESVAKPLLYYDTNIGGLLSLTTVMAEHGCKTIVFSSSATVYGEPDEAPTPETAPRRAMNPYGQTKIMSEEMLEAIMRADPEWSVGILRYFNPVGAHSSGLIGENPRDIPNNLMPYIAKVALGELPEIQVFGDDYKTPDGTGVRDYIHVDDLANAHLLSLQSLLEKREGHLVNIGTGRGYSVMEMIKAYSQACGQDLPYRITARRPGDVPIYCAKTGKAQEVLGFQAKYGLDEICASSWKWVSGQLKGQ